MSERRPPRDTRRLDALEAERLARATVAPAPDGDGDVVAVGVAAGSGPAVSRATTVSDPLTMALLAEVARSSRTVDFDPEALARVAEGAEDGDGGDGGERDGGDDDDERDDAVPVEVPHPHLKRRG